MTQRARKEFALLASMGSVLMLCAMGLGTPEGSKLSVLLLGPPLVPVGDAGNRAAREPRRDARRADVFGLGARPWGPAACRLLLAALLILSDCIQAAGQCADRQTDSRCLGRHHY